MGTIVAVGGGNIPAGETSKIDKTIIWLSGKKNPRLLYISTASDREPKVSTPMIAHFSDMGCDVSHLNLIIDSFTDDEIHKMIVDADIIYIGGGDTIRLYHVFRSTGVDRYLREAYDRGVILSGVSAGAMIWFSYGHTDSLAYYMSDWKYKRIPCLGYIPAILSPHFNDNRKKLLAELYEQGESFPALGLEDRTAMVFRDGVGTVIRDVPEANAYIYYPTAKGEVKIVVPAEGEKFDF